MTTASLLFVAFASIAAGPSSDHPGLAPPEAVAARLDAILEKGWAERKLTPSPPATDAEIFRRLSLDLRGTIPTPGEAKAFLSDRLDDKRARKIDEFLASADHAEYFARVFTEVLIGGGDLNRELRPEVLKDWLEDSFARNRPWNGVARDLVAGAGLRSESGPANFILRWVATPEDLAGATARLFLGTQIQCAQCHAHPYEKWTRDDFYGIAAFFARTKRRAIPADNPRDRDFNVLDVPRGEVFLEEEQSKRRRIEPRLLDGTPLARGRRADRRAELASWLASPANGQLARATVNRLVGLLFGRGFVEPVDDFNSKNPPSHPEALSLLASDFEASWYDVRRTLRILAGSRAYALSSAPAPGNREDHMNEGFARARLRPLDADQLFSSLVAATGVGPPPAPAPRATAPSRRPAGETPAPRGRQAGAGDGASMSPEEPMAPAMDAEDLGERDARELLRRRFVQAVRAAQAEEEPEAGFSESIPKMLLLLNGGLLNESIRVRRAGRAVAAARRDVPLRTLERILSGGGGEKEKVEEVYFAALSRPPSSAEAARAAKAIDAEKRAALAFEDLFWALLNSSEFTFNH